MYAKNYWNYLRPVSPLNFSNLCCTKICFTITIYTSSELLVSLRFSRISTQQVGVFMYLMLHAKWLYSHGSVEQCTGCVVVPQF